MYMYICATCVYCIQLFPQAALLVKIESCSETTPTNEDDNRISYGRNVISDIKTTHKIVIQLKKEVSC